MKQSQYYGGSAQEAKWHKTKGTTLIIRTKKGKKIWRNDEYLRDKICAECKKPCLECKHYN